MRIEYIEHMGTDLTVVNAARVSFDKESYWYENELSQQDKKLIDYLAKHNHWTPFAHCALTVRVTAPVFVRTQCFKHKVGFVENEISRRYVDNQPTFFSPEIWRDRAENKKQGSLETGQDFDREYFEYTNIALDFYNSLIERGVAPEIARIVLPQSMNTSWYWTGSLYAYANFYNLRTSEYAQKEIKDLARMLDPIMKDLFPYSWKILTTKDFV